MGMEAKRGNFQFHSIGVLQLNTFTGYHYMSVIRYARLASNDWDRKSPCQMHTDDGNPSFPITLYTVLYIPVVQLNCTEAFP